MKRSLLIFTLASALLASVCVCRADPWKRADVYLIQWDTETLISMTPARVRELADHKHTFRGDVTEVTRLLALDTLKPAKYRQAEDARLVVDLFNSQGGRTTYYASFFNLCSMNNAVKHPIDEKFRRRFEQLIK